MIFVTVMILLLRRAFKTTISGTSKQRTMSQISNAGENIGSDERRSNKDLRKALYKKVFRASDFGVLEPGERRRLPNCAVAKVRQIYPSDTGYYMGFKER
jgi:hypothetical protein